MRVALGWLREWIALDERGVSAEALAEQLTMAGLEVEAVERTGPDLSGRGLIVGRVLSREQHPNADRLSVCTVDLGLENGEVKNASSVRR